MSDTRPPYFPLYVLDFAGSGRVEAMTTEAVGAYILLLCKAWHQDPPCSLPDDDRTLARWARLSDDDWSSVRLMVRACWERRADGRLYQPRLDREWRKLRESQRKRADAGRKGGLTTKQRSSIATSIAAASLPALPQHSDSESESDKDRVSECAAADESPPALIGHLAKRDLSTSEQAAVWRDYDAAVALGSGGLWLASARQMAQEPGFTFSTLTAALRYLASILNRCRDTATQPGDRVVRLSVTGAPETDSPEEIRAIVAEATQRSQKRRTPA